MILLLILAYHSKHQYLYNCEEIVEISEIADCLYINYCTLDGKEIHLTPVEYKIVAYLSKNSGKVMTYASVMANVWGPFTDNNNRILRVNMANIRRKIERNPSQPQFLFTEVGVGYRMCEDENEV